MADLTPPPADEDLADEPNVPADTAPTATSREQADVGLGSVQLLARQTGLLLSSGVVSYGGALALNVLLVRRLGPAGFGAWVVAFAFGQTIATLGLFGSEWIVLRHGSYYQGTGDIERLRRTIHLALQISTVALCVMGLALGLLAPMFARHLHDPHIVSLLRIAAALGVVMGIGTVMLYGTQAFRRMRALAVVRNILEPLLRLLFVGAVLLVTRSETAAYLALLAAEVILTAIAAIALNRRVPLRGPTAAVDTRGLLKLAVPVWGERIAETARGQLFPILLGTLVALAASGVYVASRRIALAPTLIISSMNTVFAPMGSNLFLQGRLDEYARLFKTMAKWSFVLGLPVFAAVVAFPQEMLSVFGGSFRSASSTLVILAVAMLFSFATGPVTVALNQIGRPKLALYDYVLTVVLEVVFGVWLIPHHGAFGAAIALAVGTATNNLVPMLQVWMFARVHPYRVDYWKPVAAALTAVLLAKGVVATVHVGAGIGAAAVAVVVIGAVYGVLVFVLGLNEDDRAGIEALIKRVGRASAPIRMSRRGHGP